MRRTTALATTTLLGLALLGPTPAVAEVETCRGEVATVVGAPGERIVGTEGRDVVVTAGSTGVSTLGGDDLVCVTMPALEGFPGSAVEVDAGAGDDLVDGTGVGTTGVRAALGSGADRFEGGAWSDDVWAGTPVLDDTGEVVDQLDDQLDVLLGGGGSDELSSGQEGIPNPDVVEGGGGSDRLVHEGRPVPGGVVDGGAGTDVLTTPQPAGTTTIDGSTGLVTTADGTARWASVENYELTGEPGSGGPLVFRGTDGADELDVPGGGTVDADLGGGDDHLVLREAPAPGSRVDASSGTDVLLAATSGALDLDMSAGTMVVDGHVVAVRGVDHAYLAATDVRITGTAGDNELLAEGCRIRLAGGGGEDLLANFLVFGQRSRCARDVVLRGGPGHDALRGAVGDDRLLGGPGNDRLGGRGGEDVLLGGPGGDLADGGGRVDRCVAEREKRCER